MAWKPILVETLVSDVDMSAKRGYIVKAGTVAGHCALPTAATDVPIGVVMFNTATGTGHPVSVMTLGIAEMVVDGNASAIGYGVAIGTNNAGLGVVKTTDKDYIIGTAQAASTVAGDVIEVRLTGVRTLSA